MPDIDSRYVMVINLRMKPGMDDDFKQALQEILVKVRAEPACVDISGHQDPEDPSRFMLFEVWTDKDSFTEFETGREYMVEYLARVGEMWAEPRDLTIWDRVA